MWRVDGRGTVGAQTGSRRRMWWGRPEKGTTCRRYEQPRWTLPSGMLVEALRTSFRKGSWEVCVSCRMISSLRVVCVRVHQSEIAATIIATYRSRGLASVDVRVPLTTVQSILSPFNPLCDGEPEQERALQ